MATQAISHSERQSRSRFYSINAIRVIATTVGVVFGLSGMNHGFFEFLQGNKATEGLVIHAIGPEQRFWAQGTEDALTIIPNYMVSGLLSMVIGAVIVVWSLRFLHTRHGRNVFLGLFIALFLVGGGIGQIAFFLPAWAFATRMDKPLTWWREKLPQRSWRILSGLWPVTLTLATASILFGIEIAIFGVVPGVNDLEQIQNTAGLFVMASIILYIVSFIAGIGHELYRAPLSDPISKGE